MTQAPTLAPRCREVSRLGRWTQILSAVERFLRAEREWLLTHLRLDVDALDRLMAPGPYPASHPYFSCILKVERSRVATPIVMAASAALKTYQKEKWT